jgi:ubiquinol-cytochrome c reductase cytochrome b subunit
VAFIILNYLGMHEPGSIAKLVAQVCTLVYYLFFLGMPWYSRWDSTLPVPERVTS